MKNDLQKVHHSHQGKVSDKWQIYLNIYGDLLEEYRDKSIDLLEIGVQNGGSLEVWSEYFTAAKHIVGCDINPKCADLRFEDERIHLVVGDANETTTQQKILDVVSHYDVIIDDGSHTSRDIIRTFGLYFDQLKDGGVFIIEDLHCSYWQDFDGGLYHPYSSIAFLKNLVDVVNYEHWGLPLDRNEVLRDFYQHYGSRLAVDLSHIHSVEFINSVCVIRKASPVENELGIRCVVGQTDEVVSVALLPNGTKNIAPNQSGSDYKLSLQAENRQLKEELSNLSNQLSDIREEKEWFNRETNKLGAELSDSNSKLIEIKEKNKQLNSKLVDYKNILQQYERKETELHQKITDIENVNANIQNHLHHIGHEHHVLNHNYRLLSHHHLNLIGQSKKFKKLWTLTLFKPLIKTEQAISSLNRYRKGFRVLVSETGSVGKAYQTLRRLVKKDGVKAGKNLLRTAFIQKNNIHSEHTGVLNHFQQHLTEIMVPETKIALPPSHKLTQQLFDMQQAEYSRTEILGMLASCEHQPLISIVMPVYNTPLQWLERTIESLQEQIYENWELCVVDDCSPTDEQRRLLDKISRQDSRVRPFFAKENGGISAASNIALEMAKGEFIALVDHDDELPPDALFWIVHAINTNTGVDFIYTDECKIDDTEQRILYHLIAKPKWSPEIMLNGMLTGHLTAYKTDLVRELGGFRSEYDFSQDYDLALRISRVAKKIVHIERILYLWRSISGSAASGDKPYARESNLNALQDHMDVLGVPAKVVELPHANSINIDIDESQLVSIVIPSDSYENLKKAIEGILHKTDYQNYEIVAVCNTPLAERLKKEYNYNERVVFSPYDKKYNFSDKCNQGAQDASGEFVVFYNDDVFPIKSDWLYKLIEYLYLPGVGATSPKLLFENNHIQYAGMVAGTPGLCGTAYNHYGENQYDDYLSMHFYVRDISILSGACCALRRQLFEEVGGFDAVNTPDGHSDVDLSFKIMEAGYRCVYTPYSVLHHIGNHSWGAKKGKYKADIFCLKNWGKYVSEDPYFTDTMKKAIYTDFTFNYKIYAHHIQPNQTYTGKDVLLVSHELSSTGAPLMLYYAALAIKNSGGFPVVVCPEDNSLRQRFIDSGISVIIDESIREGHFLFKAFAKNFDIVVVNTIALAPVVRYLSEIEDLEIIWWLHEAQSLPELLAAYTDLAKSNVKLLCVGEYARSFIPQGFESIVLHNGIPDFSGEFQNIRKNNSDKFVFSVAGTIEPRKGQDIFCEAVTLLPDDVRQGSEFYLAGKLWDRYTGFLDRALAKVTDFPKVQYIGALNHKQAVDLLNQSDAVISCSRDDPFPLVCIEAAMAGKAIILNRNVGISEVLVRENGCLMFEPEDPYSLAEKMTFVFRNRAETEKLGKTARMAFEKHLSFEKFSESFIKILNQ